MDGSEEFVLQFCEIVGCDPEQAVMYLDMSGGNLDTAVSLYLDNNTPGNDNINNIQDLSHDVEELSDADVEESGDLRRIYNSQGKPWYWSLITEIYRPENANVGSYAANVFASSEDSGRCFYISIIQELAKRFDLPESIKGPYLLEKAREQALYSDPVKWVLMCLFVLLKVYPDW